MWYTFSRFNEYLVMAWEALKSHKMRSLLTTLGILIGVTTIITIWTTIQGLNQYVYSKLSGIGAGTIYVEKTPWIIKGDYWKYRNRKNITYNEYLALKKHCTIADHIAPEVLSLKNLSYGNEEVKDIYVIATTEQYALTAGLFPEIGRFLSEPDIRSNRFVCVMGVDVVEKLFKKENPIGRKVKIGSSRYRVIGILEKQGSAFGQSMDSFVIVPIGTFRRVFGGHRGLRIAMMTNNPGAIEEMKDEVRGIMRRVRKVKPGADDNFSINQQDMLTDLYANLTTTLFAIVFIIGGISLLVGGIGIMNIMLVSVTERTREIGIRKAVGAKQKYILLQFLIEAIMVSSIGGLLGILLGYGGGSMVLSQMDISTGVGFTSIAIGFGFSTTVGVLAGFYPAYKASRLNPIDSLRYE